MNKFTLNSYMFKLKCSQLQAVHPLKKREGKEKKKNFLVKSVQSEDY